MLYVDGGPSTTGTVGHVRMQGREVFRHAVTNLASVLGEVMEDIGLSADQIDWVVPHQANKRIIDATAKKLGLPRSEEHTSELQSLMRISYAVFCLKKKTER